MGTHNLKSVSITNLDALPIVANTIGEGAQGFVRVITDTVTPVSADDTSSTYRLLRFPTTAKIKKLTIYSAIATAGSGDIDVAFSDNPLDGTQQAFTALTNPVVQVTGPADNKLFGAAKSLVGTIAGAAVIVNELQGTFTPDMRNLPIWQALVNLGCTQFTSDPGGFFDLYIKITTTITTGGLVAGELWYVE